MAEVRLEGVTRLLSGVAAVNNLHLLVREAELLVLLGPSGCGKSTTLSLIAGLQPPQAGRIIIDGSDVVGTPTHRRNIGIVFQNYALFPHLTVAANVAFGLRMRRRSASEQRRIVLEMLALVELDGYGDRYPKQLSGGQQQRVALARALAIEPSVLLLDEPLSNLDAKLRKGLRDEIVKIQRRARVTTIFVTHDQEEALAVADRIAVMRLGSILQVGSPADIYRRPRNRFVAEFVGDANIIPGSVIETGGKEVVIHTKDLNIRAVTDDRRSIGESVVMMVRPEQVRVSANPSQSSNAFAARVVGVAYAGAAWRYALDAGGVPIVALVPGGLQAPMEVGSPVYVEWNVEDALILSDNGSVSQ